MDKRYRQRFEAVSKVLFIDQVACLRPPSYRFMPRGPSLFRPKVCASLEMGYGICGSIDIGSYRLHAGQRQSCTSQALRERAGCLGRSVVNKQGTCRESRSTPEFDVRAHFFPSGSPHRPRHDRRLRCKLHHVRGNFTVCAFRGQGWRNRRGKL